MDVRAFAASALVAGTLAFAPTSAGAAPLEQVFDADGSFTVPAGVTCIDATALGGNGGSSGFEDISGGQGGAGALVTARLPVEPGAVLTIVVGQNGGEGDSNSVESDTAPGGVGGQGYGTGGDGGTATASEISAISGGGGGGGSAVLVGADPLVVAGGGGGGGGGFPTGPGGDGGDSGEPGDAAGGPSGASGGSLDSGSEDGGDAQDVASDTQNPIGGGGGGGGLPGGQAGESRLDPATEQGYGGAGGGAGGGSFVDDSSVSSSTAISDADSGSVTIAWDDATNACGTTDTTNPIDTTDTTDPVDDGVGGVGATPRATPVRATPTFTG